MSKRILQSMLAFTLGGLMMTGTAWAQGRGHVRGTSAANHAWQGDNDGDRGAVNVGNNQTPRGWDKGRKTGWSDCDVPPGQAKKTGCAPTSRVFTPQHANVRHDRDRFRRSSTSRNSSYHTSSYRRRHDRRNHR